jgi:hypothetical protein
MLNKRGQFYLLAAIIIITVIVGFAAISNYAKKKGTVKLYDIKDELQIESGEVLEYGVSSRQDIGKLIDDFIERYQEYAGENKELYFIYGDFDEVWMVTFREILVTSKVDGKSITTSKLDTERVELNITGDDPGTKTVIATINNVDYEFELKPGENFFFVISQEIEGEKHIVSG